MSKKKQTQKATTITKTEKAFLDAVFKPLRVHVSFNNEAGLQQLINAYYSAGCETEGIKYICDALKEVGNELSQYKEFIGVPFLVADVVEAKRSNILIETDKLFNLLKQDDLYGSLTYGSQQASLYLQVLVYIAVIVYWVSRFSYGEEQKQILSMYKNIYKFASEVQMLAPSVFMRANIG